MTLAVDRAVNKNTTQTKKVYIARFVMYDKVVLTKSCSVNSPLKMTGASHSGLGRV